LLTLGFLTPHILIAVTGPQQASAICAALAGDVALTTL
jgi:hypothetical protein